MGKWRKILIKINYHALIQPQITCAAFHGRCVFNLSLLLLLFLLLLVHIPARLPILAPAAWVGVCRTPYVSIFTDTCALTFGSSEQ